MTSRPVGGTWTAEPSCWLKCGDLKANWIGTAGQESCRALVEKAAVVLIGVIEAAELDKN